MSKRKRASLGKTDQPGSEPDDATVKEDMAHVTPDVLAGSPNIFAPKWGTEDPPATASVPETRAEPVAAESPSKAVESPIERVEEEPVSAAAPMSVPPPPPTPAPSPVRTRSAGSSAALGVVLVVVGIFALGVVVLGVDLTQYGWPLFVIVPGLTLLVVGFVGGGAGASVPGGIVTMLGLVLAYQSSTGDWASWAFVWALIVPGGIGLGLYLQALRDRDPVMLRRGRSLVFVSLMVFLIGFVFFESILGISGPESYGIFGKAALPALLILIGVILLVRSIQRSRRPT
ncbi:MAG: hypothetical protein PVSMB3_20780 [Candidatus Dormibacteraceae bacterium]